jgi:hypothetical protein
MLVVFNYSFFANENLLFASYLRSSNRHFIRTSQQSMRFLLLNEANP